MLAVGCNKRPNGVLSDKDMVALMADMQVAEAYLQSHSAPGYSSDSIRDSAVQWVLDRRGLTRAEFDSTMTWYGKNLDEYRDLFAKADKELLKRQKQIPGEVEEILNFSDLWSYSRHALISENGSSNSLTFSIPAEQLEKGDKIQWKMRLNGSPALNMLLGVDYENGSSAYSYQNNNGSKVDLTLQTDSAVNVTRIFGYVRVKEDRYLPVWIDSISLQSTPLDSTQYYRIHSQRKMGKPIRKVEDKVGDTDTVSSKIMDSVIDSRVADSEFKPIKDDDSKNNHPVRSSGKPINSKKHELKKVDPNKNVGIKPISKPVGISKDASIEKPKHNPVKK